MAVDARLVSHLIFVFVSMPTIVLIPHEALTDGDQFEKVGSRVLIQDEELWPMAKGEIDFNFNFFLLNLSYFLTCGLGC